jgi:uncharacterized protein YdcH (DUF465 family)
MIQKHQLIEEFPEHADRIHELKENSAHFKKLFDEYDNLDHDVYRIETDTEPASDDTLNKLRGERVKLKDELYHLIQTL